MSKDRWAKGLTVAGNMLTWGALLAPVIFSLRGFLSGGEFNFDFLIPAELFPVVALGGVLLLGAAILVRRRVKWIAWGLGAALALLVGGQALAVVSGLAAGEIEPAGLPWALVIASIAGYTLAVIALGVGGVLLARDLFQRSK